MASMATDGNNLQGYGEFDIAIPVTGPLGLGPITVASQPGVGPRACPSNKGQGMTCLDRMRPIVLSRRFGGHLAE